MRGGAVVQRQGRLSAPTVMANDKYRTALDCRNLRKTDGGKSACPPEVTLLAAGELARSLVAGEITVCQFRSALRPFLEELRLADGGAAAMGLIDSHGEYWP